MNELYPDQYEDRIKINHTIFPFHKKFHLTKISQDNILKQ